MGALRRGLGIVALSGAMFGAAAAAALALPVYGPLGYSGDGTRLAVGWSDDGHNELRVYDSRTGQPTFVTRVAYPIEDIAFAPTGALVAVAQRVRGSAFAIDVWDTAAGEKVASLRARGVAELYTNRIAFVARRNTLAIARTGREPSLLWNYETGKSVRLSPGGYAITTASSGLFVAYADPFQIEIRRVGNKRLIKTFGSTAWPWPGPMSYGAANRLLAAGRDIDIEVWNAKTGVQVHRLAAGQNRVRAISFQPKFARLAAISSSDSTIRVWNARTGKLFRAIQTDEPSFNDVAIAPIGGHLAATSSYILGSRLMIWNINSGEFLHSIQ